MPWATPFTPPGATRNLEKRILLLIVNLQFSKFVGKWYWWPCCTPTFLLFGFLDIEEVSLDPSSYPILQTIWTSKNWGFGDLFGFLEKSKIWLWIAHNSKEIERRSGHSDGDKFGVSPKDPHIDQFQMRTKKLVELRRHAYRGNKI